MEQIDSGPVSWWQLLSSLKQVTRSDGKEAELQQEFCKILEQGQAIVQTDEQWKASGVPEMFTRALSLAKKGALDAARRLALNMADFHSSVEALRYRQSLAKACSPDVTGNKRTQEQRDTSSTSSATSDVTSTDVPAPGTSQGTAHASMGLDLSSSGSPMATSSGGLQLPVSASPSPTATAAHQAHSVFPMPAPKRRRTDSSRIHYASSGNPQEWTGVLGILAEDGSRVSDLCQATMQLPDGVSSRVLPKAVHFTHLAQRRGVMLGQYQVVRTTIKKANMRQMSRLRSMAQHELVAVAGMGHNNASHLIVVPYHDNKSQLRLVSFMLNTASPDNADSPTSAS